MSSKTIMELGFLYYLSINQAYFQVFSHGLGASDEFIELYCMGNEL